MKENRKSAFTLIELLAVMTIILILAAMVLYTARYVTEKAKRAKAEAYVKAKCAEAEAFYAEHRYYPAWSSNGIGTDPWGMPYIYLAYDVAGVGYTQRQQFVVYCMGPDQTPGSRERPGTALGDGDDTAMGNYGRIWGTQKD
jgi:prepilin-type N-terminal cleavage/methylation domain-containing protein